MAAIRHGCVDLEIREIRRRPDESRYVWTPFEPSDQFNGDWWDQPPYMADDPLYVQVLLDGTEVARVELDEDFSGSRHVGAPTLGHQALEIQSIEVAESHRRQGIGAEVVARLAAAYSGRRLLALSEGADDFWASLGWDRYDYSDGPLKYRPLFIQPASSSGRT